jgi:hypothetical protein
MPKKWLIYAPVLCFASIFNGCKLSLMLRKDNSKKEEIMYPLSGCCKSQRFRSTRSFKFSAQANIFHAQAILFFRSTRSFKFSAQANIFHAQAILFFCAYVNNCMRIQIFCMRIQYYLSAHPSVIVCAYKYFVCAYNIVCLRIRQQLSAHANILSAQTIACF